MVAALREGVSFLQCVLQFVSDCRHERTINIGPYMPKLLQLARVHLRLYVCRLLTLVHTCQSYCNWHVFIYDCVYVCRLLTLVHTCQSYCNWHVFIYDCVYVCRQAQRSSIVSGTPNPVFVADLLEYVSLFADCSNLWQKCTLLLYFICFHLCVVFYSHTPWEQMWLISIS